MITSKVTSSNGGNTPVEVRAFRANDDLLAAVAFDRDSYAVGDTAHIAFTLTNRSALSH